LSKYAFLPQEESGRAQTLSIHLHSLSRFKRRYILSSCDTRYLELRCSALTSFGPRHNVLSKVCKFVSMMLDTSSSCWTTFIRVSHSTIFLNFGFKALLTNLRNLSLSLSLRRGPWRFQVWLGGLGPNEVGIEVSEYIDSQEQGTVSTR